MSKIKYLLVLLLLAGCVMAVPNQQIAPSFTHANLFKSGLVIGGVNHRGGKAWTHDERLKYSDEAVDGLHFQQRSLPVKDAEWLIQKVGKKKFIALNDKLRTTEDPMSDAEMKELAGKLPDTRYIMFSTLTSESTVHSTSTMAGFDKNNHLEKFVNFTTRSTMYVSIKIYDIRERIVAWSASVEEIDTNRDSVTHEQADLKTTFEYIGQPGRPIALTYETDTTARLLFQSFRRIGKSLGELGNPYPGSKENTGYVNPH